MSKTEKNAQVQVRAKTEAKVEAKAEAKTEAIAEAKVIAEEMVISEAKAKIIYVADDETNIRLAIKTFLENAGYAVEDFENGDLLLSAFSERPADLVILDVMMPGSNGFVVCKELRKKSLIPIIMLTARDSDLDYATGLDLGSDDYLIKPFSPMALVMRVKAVFRRMEYDRQAYADQYSRVPETKSETANREEGGKVGGKGGVGITCATGVAGTKDVTCATGVKGTKGTTGVVGAPGTRGATSTAGTAGTTGETNTKGTTGATSTAGTTGTTGTTSTTGTVGTKGTTGTMSTAGTTDTTGTTSTTGTVGTKGTTGATSTAGTAGTTGTTY